MIRSVLAAVAAAVMLNACGGGYDSATPTAAPEAAWKLVWADEFDGAAIDAMKWSFETGGNGWGNEELQYYTPGDNAKVEGGNLTIEARKESFGGNGYTSARLLTKGKAEWTYGRIEARIKMPYGNGLWAAFWMLGANIDSVSWPGCGEMDIVEMFGTQQWEPGVDWDALAFGAVHWPNADRPSEDNYVSQRFGFPGRPKLHDEFHVYAMEWSATAIKHFVDGNLYHVVDLTSREIAEKGFGDVHQKPFFMLLNLAVGGNAVGPPDVTTVWPQQMVVDWVRVYQR